MKKVVYMSAVGILGAVLLAAALVGAAGCEKSERYRHEFLPGNGALVVDNITGDDIEVFIDGAATNRVRSGNYRVYDLPPDVYRLVLDGRRSNRLYRDDVDIIERRLTILEVYVDLDDYSGFRVMTSID